VEERGSRGYTKDALRAGWTHPLGRDRLWAILRERGVHPDLLALAMPDPEERPLLLVRVRRYGDLSLEGRWRRDADDAALDPVTLRIAALPRDRLHAGRDALAAGTLDAALQWILDARGRGNAWQATERVWTAHLVDGAVVVAEQQRQSRGAYLGFIGAEDL
jgi:hypothetical protein